VLVWRCKGTISGRSGLGAAGVGKSSIKAKVKDFQNKGNEEAPKG